MKQEYSSESESDDCGPEESNIMFHGTTNHAMLRNELLGRVKYDDPTVFARLHINDEDSALIDQCHRQYQVQQERDLDELTRIARDSEIPPREADNGDPEKKQYRKSQEARVKSQMYGPLQAIFDFLTAFGGPERASRRFAMSANSPHSWKAPGPEEEAFTPGLPSMRPDFDLVDNCANAHYWDGCLGFAEIKVAASENTKPQEERKTFVTPAVLQCADYARVHLARRHFWLFTVALLITGTDFRVMIVDHAGVLLSPLHSIINDNRASQTPRDARTFVRVVRALTRLLGEADLGQDPSVSLVPRHELQSYIRRSVDPTLIPDAVKAAVLQSEEQPCHEFPSYSIRVPDTAGVTRIWCTMGPPIWVSPSLLGRATTVWRAIEVIWSGQGYSLSGHVRILKSSWRDPRRSREADVYAAIGALEDCPKGIPQMLCGGDVYYELPGTLKRLTTAAIRGEAENGGSRVLHRIVLSIVGEPLWKYQDDLHLLRAFRDVVETHQYLCSNGILHQDISAGNLLLNSFPTLDDLPSPPTSNERLSPPNANEHRAQKRQPWGFLSDFDMAHVNVNVLGHVLHEHGIEPQKRVEEGPEGQPITTPPRAAIMSHIQFTETKHHGVPVTGTLQFMASSLLDAIRKNSPLKHTASHDLESIAYVLGYAVLRSFVILPDCPEVLKAYFNTTFGGMNIVEIINARAGRQPLAWPSQHLEQRGFLKKHMSFALASLMSKLRHAIDEEYARHYDEQLEKTFESESEPSPAGNARGARCTHEYFLKVLDRAIERLEGRGVSKSST